MSRTCFVESVKPVSTATFKHVISRVAALISLTVNVTYPYSFHCEAPQPKPTFIVTQRSTKAPTSLHWPITSPLWLSNSLYCNTILTSAPWMFFNSMMNQQMHKCSTVCYITLVTMPLCFDTTAPSAGYSCLMLAKLRKHLNKNWWYI
jgi:hypothetical protein